MVEGLDNQQLLPCGTGAQRRQRTRKTTGRKDTGGVFIPKASVLNNLSVYVNTKLDE